MTNDNEIPEAGNESDEPEAEGAPPGGELIPPLVIGDPFAIGYGCDLMDRREAEPGTMAVVKCYGQNEQQPCGQLFKINLLDAGFKTCPRCGQSFSHMLLIAPADDDEIVRDAVVAVLEANGMGYVMESDQADGGEEPPQ